MRPLPALASALVALMLVHFIVTGRWLKSAAKGKPLPSSTATR